MSGTDFDLSAITPAALKSDTRPGGYKYKAYGTTQKVKKNLNQMPVAFQNVVRAWNIYSPCTYTVSKHTWHSKAQWHADVTYEYKVGQVGCERILQGHVHVELQGSSYKFICGNFWVVSVNYDMSGCEGQTPVALRDAFESKALNEVAAILT